MPTVKNRLVEAFCIDHFAWKAQVAARNPSWKIVFLAIVGPVLIEQFIKAFCVALKFPATDWIRIGWFCVSIGSFGVVVSGLLKRYPLFPPPVATRATQRQHQLSLLVIVVPMVIYYVLPGIRIGRRLPPLMSMAATRAEREQIAAFFLEVYEQSWSRLGYGTDGLGIVLASLLVLVMPLAEEILCRGYLMNSLNRFFSPLVSAFIAAGIFASAHVFHFRNLGDFWSVFIMGIGYGLIRLLTGKWTAAWMAHVSVNLAIMYPKWFLVAVKFWIVPRLMEGSP